MFTKSTFITVLVQQNHYCRYTKVITKEISNFRTYLSKRGLRLYPLLIYAIWAVYAYNFIGVQLLSSISLGFYRDHQWPLDSEDSGRVYDYRGGIRGTLKSGAYIFSDPVLGNVVSLNKSESWILMGNFSGTVHSLYVHKKRLSF